MVSIPTTEPEQFTAGDTVQWTRSLGDYPPDTWTLAYTFVSDLGLFTVTATDNGDGNYLAKLSPAESAPIVAAQYTWTANVSDTSDRFTIGHGTTQVLRNLAADLAPIDTRTHARIVLDNIKAVLEGTASTDQASFSIPDGMSISRYPLADLMSLKDRYTQIVNNEEAAERLRKGLGHPSRLLVRL